MKIITIIIIAIAFILAVADTLFTIALWVINKIDKEETEDYDRRL